MIYDDNALFNNYFDNVNEEIIIRGIAISQSKALFYEDEEAYREELMSFHNEKNSCIIALKTGFTEEKVNDICEYKSVLLAEDLDIISNYFKDKEDSFNALPQYIKDNFKEIFQEENIPLGYDVRIKF